MKKIYAIKSIKDYILSVTFYIIRNYENEVKNESTYSIRYPRF